MQEPVLIPRFQFQYTSNFDFYPLGKCDFIPLEPPPHHYAVLRSDIAICLWESLKMKVHFILAASRNGNCDAVFDLLSTYIPSAKLQEIDMLPPPFPSVHQLTFNPFLRPGHPAVIESVVSSWQTTSRMLSVWIAKAQENSVRCSSCSWSWPPSPICSCVGTGFLCCLPSLYFSIDWRLKRIKSFVYLKKSLLIAQQKPYKNTIKSSLQFPYLFVLFGEELLFL